jgi:hypothetical protein
MTKKPTPSTEARDLRALLATVVDALTLPYDLDDYDQRLLRRAGLVRVLVSEALKETPDSLGWNVDYLRTKLTAEQADADKRECNRCRRCRTAFDPTDTRFDGRDRYASTPWCRSCIDNCREGGTGHMCPICEPARYGGEGR